MTITILRTNSDNADFKSLAAELESDLKIRDGDEHAFYANLNRIEKLNHVLVLYLDDVAVACGGLRAYSAYTVEVKRMFVLPGYRNQGYASQLLGQLEQWSIEMGFDTCVLETGANQPEAIHLYEKSQYQHIAPFGAYVESPNSICFMKKINADHS